MGPTTDVRDRRTMNAIDGLIRGEAKRRGWLLPNGKWTVPMADPNINFGDYIARAMYRQGFRGQGLDDEIQKVVISQFLNKEDGTMNGPVFQAYDPTKLNPRTGQPTPFDLFVQYTVKNRGRSFGRDKATRERNLPSQPIEQSGRGEADDPVGVTQETVPGKEPDPKRDEETREYMQDLYENIMEMLTHHRHPHVLQALFHAQMPKPWGLGLTHPNDIVDHFNEIHLESGTPGVFTWTAGQVSSYRTRLQELVDRYIDAEDSWEQGEGPLKRLRKRDKRTQVAPVDPNVRPPEGEKTPSSEDVPLVVPSRGPGEMIWVHKGQQFRVRAKRRGADHTRVYFKTLGPDKRPIEMVVPSGVLTVAPEEGLHELSEAPPEIVKAAFEAGPGQTVTPVKKGPQKVVWKYKDGLERGAVIKRRGGNNTRIVLDEPMKDATGKPVLKDGKPAIEMVVPNSELY